MHLVYLHEMYVWLAYVWLERAKSLSMSDTRGKCGSETGRCEVAEQP